MELTNEQSRYIKAIVRKTKQIIAAVRPLVAQALQAVNDGRPEDSERLMQQVEAMINTMPLRHNNQHDLPPWLQEWLIAENARPRADYSHLKH
jgi:hypothetical protein